MMKTTKNLFSVSLSGVRLGLLARSLTALRLPDLTQLGHLVSRRCAAKIPNLVVESSLSVARATLRMADDLRSCPVDCSSSGATCVLTTIQDGKVRYYSLAGWCGAGINDK